MVRCRSARRDSRLARRQTQYCAQQREVACARRARHDAGCTAVGGVDGLVSQVVHKWLLRRSYSSHGCADRNLHALASVCARV